jgi:hypothetical protein
MTWTGRIGRGATGSGRAAARWDGNFPAKSAARRAARTGRHGFSVRQPAAHRDAAVLPSLPKNRAEAGMARKLTAFWDDLYPISLYEERAGGGACSPLSLGREVCPVLGRGGVGWV